MPILLAQLHHAIYHTDIQRITTGASKKNKGATNIYLHQQKSDITYSLTEH